MSLTVGAAVAQSTSSGPVMTNTTSAGTVLTDAKGMTLYTFDRDGVGVSNCSGACATTWPPTAPGDGDLTSDPDVGGVLDVIDRADGSQQVTYNGMPLYAYRADTQPGAVKGDGVGGVWHIAMP